MLKLDFASSLKPVKRAKRAKTPFFGVFGVFGPKMTLFGGLKKGVFFDPFFGPKNEHMFFGVTKNSVIPKNEYTPKMVYTKKRVDTPKNEYIPKSGVHQKTS
jgi:hypothetical protein